MLPYSRGLIIDNASNYGIVKTETVFGFGPNSDNYVNSTFNSTEPLEWIFTRGNFGQGSVPDPITSQSDSRAYKDSKPKTSTTTSPPPQQRSKKIKKGIKKLKKKLKRKAKKTKKCIFKVIKKGKKNRGGKFKMHKKYMLPLILGLLAAKSLLIPIALKALAFLSAKGLMMGFFSTVMASVLSLKGMFDHHHGYQNRKDDTKTQVEIIQVPSKSEDSHVYYDDHYNHYKRGDYEFIRDYNNYNNLPTIIRAVEHGE
ncbi:uncharacterized protein LOC135083872 [Ostrinia nubilalis]|uniref:uncharacterized protein LOC135083872 n=1 Tax=Ostrinia nubilalis TaxID=29057 RepID=UPI0030825B97